MSTTNAVAAPTIYTPPTNTNISGQSKGTGTNLGEDSFLKLLVSQLQNQDPLNPISNTDFIAQLAQFSSLQQMTSLNSNVSNQGVVSQMSTGATLIGKTITSNLADADGNPITGVVKSATISSDAKGVQTVNLDIGNTSVPISSVIQIK